MFDTENDEPLPIYTLDIETDPFEHGKMIYPFCLGFYDGVTFKSTWGPKCVQEMRKWVEGLPAGIIYIHNGGRFDLFYLMDWLSGKMMIINSRIVRARMDTGSGIHEIRDSYAIMPFALRQYKKDDIDYNLLRKEVREKHKKEIISYLKGDCVYLHELCSAFVEKFGPQITIGSTAMKELKKIHQFQELNERDDEEIRSNYYYGGRVQCFQKGVVNQPVKIFDVNSMYPHAMQSFKHPLGAPVSVTKKISKNTCFVTAEGKNYGAFPSREKGGGLRFDIEEGTFGVSIHEWKTALALGLFVPSRIVRCYNFDNRGTFSDFVSHFYNARAEAKASNDATSALFYKYILNSAYGKFAQNPENYFDYKIAPDTEDFRMDGWEPDMIDDVFGHIIWRKPSDSFIRHNVATAASITGAARSILMRAIAYAKNPIYCDTDSIICEDLEGVEIDDKKLGAWKLEGIGSRAAVAGKKLYAIFSDTCPSCGSQSQVKRHEECFDKWHEHGCIKQANKGVRISPEEIEAVCSGHVIQFEKDSPSFKWDGTHKFIRRKVRMT